MPPGTTQPRIGRKLLDTEAHRPILAGAPRRSTAPTTIPLPTPAPSIATKAGEKPPGPTGAAAATSAVRWEPGASGNRPGAPPGAKLTPPHTPDLGRDAEPCPLMAAHAA